MSVIYLDTNHVSHVARYPDHADSRVILGLLGTGAYRLGVSLIHLQELSAPTFASRHAVGSLLDNVPVSWALSPDEVFRREIHWGIERAVYGVNPPRQVFLESFEYALGAPPEANIPISAMLEVFANRTDLRAHLREAAEHGARADSTFKRTAAVVRSPDEPILSHIRDIRMAAASAGVVITQGHSDEEILKRAGGLSSFPAHNVVQGLARSRLGDERFPTDENDVFDEWHACYAPYCAATVLDRSTAARFRTARLPDAHRVTHRLREVPEILQRATPA